MIALQVQDVDLHARRIRINTTATINADGKPTIGEPKHGERREVPIAPHLIRPLEEVTRSRPATVSLVRSQRGLMSDAHNWRYRVWNPSVRLAALPQTGLTPKALRHTAASMAIAAGADVKVVQRMLGHADATMTLNTYAELWPDRLDDVSDAISEQRERALRTRSMTATPSESPRPASAS